MKDVLEHMAENHQQENHKPALASDDVALEPKTQEVVEEVVEVVKEELRELTEVEHQRDG